MVQSRRRPSFQRQAVRMDIDSVCGWKRRPVPKSSEKDIIYDEKPCVVSPCDVLNVHKAI
jgi:hypothetical protein